MAFRVREMTGQPVHVRAAGGAHEDAGFMFNIGIVGSGTG